MFKKDYQNLGTSSTNTNKHSFYTTHTNIMSNKMIIYKYIATDGGKTLPTITVGFQTHNILTLILLPS